MWHTRWFYFRYSKSILNKDSNERNKFSKDMPYPLAYHVSFGLHVQIERTVLNSIYCNLCPVKWKEKIFDNTGIFAFIFNKRLYFYMKNMWLIIVPLNHFLISVTLYILMSQDNLPYFQIKCRICTRGHFFFSFVLSWRLQEVFHSFLHEFIKCN
jgi:hypothetical protein